MSEASWFEPVEFYFGTIWYDKSEHGNIPSSFYKATRRLVRFETQLVVPADMTLAQDEVRVLMVGALTVGDDLSVVVRFEAPDRVIVRHFGSLGGGEYIEEMTVGSDRSSELVGTYSHARLDAPLRIVSPPDFGERMGFEGQALKDAVDRVGRARQLYRDWAIAYRPASSQ